MNDFNSLYLGQFKLSDRELALLAAAERYVRECEEYDRTVCTGPVTCDGVMPNGIVEAGMITRNSKRVLQAVCDDSGFKASEIIRAASTIKPGDLL